MNWDFSKATVNNSAIGPEARTYNILDPRQAELHQRLEDLRDTLVDDGSDRHAQLAGLIDDLDRAVAGGQAEPAMLAGRWERIRAALGPALQTTANVAQISGLLVQLAQG